MLILYKLQPHPNDSSRSSWKSRKGSFNRISAEETYDRQGKASFGSFRHSNTRSIYISWMGRKAFYLQVIDLMSNWNGHPPTS